MVIVEDTTYIKFVSGVHETLLNMDTLKTMFSIKKTDWNLVLNNDTIMTGEQYGSFKNVIGMKAKDLFITMNGKTYYAPKNSKKEVESFLFCLRFASDLFGMGFIREYMRKIKKKGEPYTVHYKLITKYTDGYQEAKHVYPDGYSEIFSYKK